MGNKIKLFLISSLIFLILVTACSKGTTNNAPNHIYPEIQGSVVQINVNGNYIAEVKGEKGYVNPPTSTYCYGSGGVIIGVIENGTFKEKASFSFEANKDENDNVFCLPILPVRYSSAFLFPEGITVTQNGLIFHHLSKVFIFNGDGEIHSVKYDSIQSYGFALEGKYIFLPIPFGKLVINSYEDLLLYSGKVMCGGETGYINLIGNFQPPENYFLDNIFPGEDGDIYVTFTKIITPSSSSENPVIKLYKSHVDFNGCDGKVGEYSLLATYVATGRKITSDKFSLTSEAAYLGIIVDADHEEYRLLKINLNNGEVESRIIGLVHSLYVSSAFSSDGKYLAVADTKNKVIYLYDIENDTLTTLSLPSLNFPFATFPRGDFLIFEGDNLYVIGVDDKGEMKVVGVEKIE